jgi:hypothetical protein
VNVEWKIAELDPVVVNGCQGLGADMELVVDGEEFLDLALGQTLSHEVFDVLLWKLGI